LGAVAVAREFETKTASLLIIAPINPLFPMIGRILATSIISAGTMALAVAIVIFGHGVIPTHPFALIMTLLLCILIFGFLGAALGAILKRSLPVAALVYGIALPLYLFSGTYEPERFDGNTIWILAHFSPLYYAVGMLEYAALDLRVTPEPVWLNMIILLGWATLALFSLQYTMRRTKV
jgi:ABC-type multidrug transport system permease subunit